MDAPLVLTLPNSDIKLISNSDMSPSERVRELLADFNSTELRKYVEMNKKTTRVSCRIPLETALELDKLAKELDMQPGKLARAIIEMKLHSQ